MNSVPWQTHAGAYRGETASGKSALALARRKRRRPQDQCRQRPGLSRPSPRLGPTERGGRGARAAPSLRLSRRRDACSAADWAADAEGGDREARAERRLPILARRHRALPPYLSKGSSRCPRIDPWSARRCGRFRWRRRMPPWRRKIPRLPRTHPAGDTTRAARASRSPFTGKPLKAWQAEKAAASGATVALSVILLPRAMALRSLRRALRKILSMQGYGSQFAPGEKIARVAPVMRGDRRQGDRGFPATAR